MSLIVMHVHVHVHNTFTVLGIHELTTGTGPSSLNGPVVQVQTKKAPPAKASLDAQFAMLAIIAVYTVEIYHSRYGTCGIQILLRSLGISG